MKNNARGGPLAGIRVLELTKVWAGPYAGKQLAFLGAEVIKVESAGSLDVTRVYGTSDINLAPGFQAVNPQRLSATIDVKSKSGTALLLDPAAKCDILVENLRPGAIARLGHGDEAVKSVRPDIIVVSMSMNGNAGPLAYQTGYAPCFVALGGAAWRLPCQGNDCISIAVPSDAAWLALSAAMGQAALPGDPRSSTHAARKANEPTLDALMAN